MSSPTEKAVGPALIVIVAVTILYWAIAPFFPSKYVIEFIDGIAVVTSATVALVYGRRFLKVLSNPNPDVYDLVLAGICGGWSVNALDRSWRLVARMIDTSLPNDYYIGYLLALLSLFASFHLLVRGPALADGRPTYQRITLDAWAAIAIALVLGSALGAAAVIADIML